MAGGLGGAPARKATAACQAEADLAVAVALALETDRDESGRIEADQQVERDGLQPVDATRSTGADAKREVSVRDHVLETFSDWTDL